MQRQWINKTCRLVAATYLRHLQIFGFGNVTFEDITFGFGNNDFTFTLGKKYSRLKLKYNQCGKIVITFLI